MILGEEEEIGRQVQQWRTNLGLTMAEAARVCGVAANVLSRIESGATPHPRYSTVHAIFTGLGAVIEATMGNVTRQPDPPQLPLRPRKPDNRVHADA